MSLANLTEEVFLIGVQALQTTWEAEEHLSCSLPTASQSDPSIKQSGHNKANFSSFHFSFYATSTTEKRLGEAIKELRDTILISGKSLK